jgi:CRP-like cAMP-binding protein
VKTLFLMHLAACVWHWTAILTLPESLSDLSEAERLAGVTLSQARINAAMGTWLQYFAPTFEQGEKWPTTLETYAASMYWALTTMSTIGYGDIKSITNVERFVSIVIMLVGSVIFGIVIGGMQNLMKQINSVRHRAVEKMDWVKAMLRDRRVPKWLLHKVARYYSHFLIECYDVTTERRILNELCPPLRTEILLFLNAHIIESIHFFRGQDSTFIASVCKLLKPCFFAPQDWIFKEGELGLEMYFMQTGKVDILCFVDSEEVLLETLEYGSYFGEVAILLDGLRREASAKAVSFCAMFSFTKLALSQLLEMYPDVSKTMGKQIGARLRKWRVKRIVSSGRKSDKRLLPRNNKDGSGDEHSSRGDSGRLSHDSNDRGSADGRPSSTLARLSSGARLSSSSGRSLSRLSGSLKGVIGRCMPHSRQSSSRISSSMHEQGGAGGKSTDLGCGAMDIARLNNTDAIEQALQRHEAMAREAQSIEEKQQQANADAGDVANTACFRARASSDPSIAPAGAPAASAPAREPSDGEHFSGPPSPSLGADPGMLDEYDRNPHAGVLGPCRATQLWEQKGDDPRQSRLKPEISRRGSM